MILTKFDYQAPASLDEACRIMAHFGDRARLLAGGTDLLIALKRKQARPALVVALDRVEELKGIATDSDGILIGARTTVTELADTWLGPAEQALARELKEELGLSLTGCRYFATCPNVYPYQGITYRTLDLAFVCQVNNTEKIRWADDVAGIRWIDLDRPDLSQFGLESIRWFVELFAATGGG